MAEKESHKEGEVAGTLFSAPGYVSWTADKTGEAMQRRANKGHHSERVLHGGNPGSGSKAK